MAVLNITAWFHAAAGLQSYGSQRQLIVSKLMPASGIKPKTSMITPWLVAFTPDTSKSRLGKKATWNVGGVDISEVKVTDYGNYFQLHMPAQAELDEFYLDESFPGTDIYFTPDDSWKRLVTIEPTSLAPYRTAVGPSRQAIQSNPELVTIPGVAGYDVFAGSNFYPHDTAGVFMSPSTPINVSSLPVMQKLPDFPAFLLPDTSQDRIFYRYPVFDPDDLPSGGTQGTMFMGIGYLDWPPFTAEVDVFMAGKRSPAEFALDDFMVPGHRFTIPQSEDALAYVSSAVEAARKLIDLTLLQPKPTPIFSAGKPFIVGTDHYRIGQAQLSV